MPGILLPFRRQALPNLRANFSVAAIPQRLALDQCDQERVLQRARRTVYGVDWTSQTGRRAKSMRCGR